MLMMVPDVVAKKRGSRFDTTARPTDSAPRRATPLQRKNTLLSHQIVDSFFSHNFNGRTTLMGFQ